VIERKALRVEVEVAEKQAVARWRRKAPKRWLWTALNLAIGLNVNAPTGVRKVRKSPLRASLAECLQAAVGMRREFQVARDLSKWPTRQASC